MTFPETTRRILLLLSVFFFFANTDSKWLPAEIQAVWTDADPGKTLADVHILGGAALLPDGRVLVAGGLIPKAPYSAVTTAEVYDPSSGRWTLTGPLKTPRWSLDAVALRNGKVLFAGGAAAFLAPAALATAEVFDPATGTFSPAANELSTARQGYGISILGDGRVLISGGNGSGNNLGGEGVTAVDLYDPETNRFSPAAPLHAGRALHAQLTLRDGRVVVIGGAHQDAEIYDPGTDRWTSSQGKLPTTLKDMKAFELYNGRIFIAGGQNSADGLTTDNTWFFDPGTTKFTPGPSMAGFNSAPSGSQTGTSDYSAFDLFPTGHKRTGRFLLIAGGEHDPPEGPDVELNSASIFDAVQNEFIRIGPMPFVHDDHTESALRFNAAGNPEFLLFGGNKSQGTSRVEIPVSSLPAD